jgi:hypothetical protein
MTFLLVVTAIPCFAETAIYHVFRERAQELGMEVRSKAAGTNDLWVELEFKTEGRFKDFDPERRNSRVEMRIMEGGKLLVGYAALREKRSSSGGIVVGFMANRAYIENITLSVVVGSGLLSGGAYELRLKDFVEPEKVPQERETKR